MAKITLITGGQRSGKSSYAQQKALSWSGNPVYLATSRIWDADFHERIKRHQADRGSEWENVEEEKDLAKLSLNGKVVLLDCITLWLTNIYHDNAYDCDKSLAQAIQIWDAFVQKDCTLLVVTNELGMSLHGENEVGRKFQDLQGWMNQHIAKQAEEVVLMVSGVPVKIK